MVVIMKLLLWSYYCYYLVTVIILFSYDRYRLQLLRLSLIDTLYFLLSFCCCYHFLFSFCHPHIVLFINIESIILTFIVTRFFTVAYTSVCVMIYFDVYLSVLSCYFSHSISSLFLNHIISVVGLLYILPLRRVISK